MPMKSNLIVSVDGAERNGLVDITDFTINKTTEAEVKNSRIDVKYTGQGGSGTVNLIVLANSELNAILNLHCDFTSAKPVINISSDVISSTSCADELIDFFGNVGASIKLVQCELEKTTDFSREASVQDKITKTYHITFKVLSEPMLIEA